MVRDSLWTVERRRFARFRPSENLRLSVMAVR